MEVDPQTVILAFSLTLLAGLATCIGSAIAFFAKRTNTNFLSLSLGFSAGVMIYVSFVEILVKAKDSLTSSMGEVTGQWLTAGAFFGGILIAAMIDKLVPSAENPHEIHDLSEMDRKTYEEQNRNRKLMNTGLVSAFAIAIHNFPEGLATFAAALQSPKLGISIAVAIAIHNIPEGIAVSVPVYYATGSRKKAFWYSFISGVAEPIGAIVGYFIFRQFFTDCVFGVLFAGVAGIMVFISLDELLPSAEKYGHHHLMVYGLISGMALMALSLLLFL